MQRPLEFLCSGCFVQLAPLELLEARRDDKAAWELSMRSTCSEYDVGVLEGTVVYVDRLERVEVNKSGLQTIAYLNCDKCGREVGEVYLNTNGFEDISFKLWKPRCSPDRGYKWSEKAFNVRGLAAYLQELGQRGLKINYNSRMRQREQQQLEQQQRDQQRREQQQRDQQQRDQQRREQQQRDQQRREQQQRDQQRRDQQQRDQQQRDQQQRDQQQLDQQQREKQLLQRKKQQRKTRVNSSTSKYSENSFEDSIERLEERLRMVREETRQQAEELATVCQRIKISAQSKEPLAPSPSAPPASPYLCAYKENTTNAAHIAHARTVFPSPFYLDQRTCTICHEEVKPDGMDIMCTNLHCICSSCLEAFINSMCDSNLLEICEDGKHFLCSECKDMIPISQVREGPFKQRLLLASKRRLHNLLQEEEARRQIQAEENARIRAEHAERIRVTRALRQAREVARCEEEEKARMKAQVKESAKIRTEHTERVRAAHVMRQAEEQARRQAQEEAHVQRQTQAQRALAELARREAERKRGEVLQRAQTHIRHIENSILLTCCPNGHPFFDFDGDFALTCLMCGCHFCAWCLTDCQSVEETHRHILNCSQRNPSSYGVAGTDEEFRNSCHVRYQRRFRTYWGSDGIQSDSRDVRRLILQRMSEAHRDLLEPELQRLGYF